MTRTLLPLALATVLLGCSDVKDGPGTDSEQELITVVGLSFTPLAGGPAIEARWEDPEGDGNPVVDDIVLPEGEHLLSVTFLNGLEDPPEDIGLEVDDEADQHQIFLTGSAVEGPATAANPAAILSHAYADEDPDGLPLGRSNDITTLSTGTGELVITLRHLPPEDGAPTKTADLAETVASSGFSAIPGDTDVQVGFAITVE